MLSQLVGNPAGIEAGALAMADQVWTWCEKANAFGRTVTVKIKYTDFGQATRSQSLSAQITSAAVLRQVSLDLVRPCFHPRKVCASLAWRFQTSATIRSPLPSSSISL